VPPRVTAVGEQTSLSDRKRRAGQRLLLQLPGPALDYDMRALLRVMTPAGFVVDPRGAEEPLQLMELSAELAARLPPALPPLLAARHPGGRACPGTTAQPPMAWLARAEDPELSAAVGQAWRRELAALGFVLHLGPSCELEALSSEPLPPVEGEPAAVLAGPSPEAAVATLGAFVAHDDGVTCAACPSLCQGWLRDGRIVALEKELPGLLAEDLAPVLATVRAGVPALLLGHGRWSAFNEQLPCWCLPSFIQERLREHMGFRGLLLAEDPALIPDAERLRREPLLLAALEAGLDAWIPAGGAAAQADLFEALVKLQERNPGLDTPLDLATKRMLRTRERLLLHRAPPRPDVLDSPAHRDLVLLARARGS
jgi:beta-N-acetylhexosaminidase